jgi:hypothetical protein
MRPIGMHQLERSFEATDVPNLKAQSPSER